MKIKPKDFLRTLWRMEFKDEGEALSLVWSNEVGGDFKEGIMAFWELAREEGVVK